jgi:hypothetical protein
VKVDQAVEAMESVHLEKDHGISASISEDAEETTAAQTEPKIPPVDAEIETAQEAEEKVQQEVKAEEKLTEAAIVDSAIDAGQSDNTASQPGKLRCCGMWSRIRVASSGS